MRRRILRINKAKLPRKKDVVVEETTRITTEPKVEVRKAGTLAQALTEPAAVVVKPETKARVVRRKVRRAA